MEIRVLKYFLAVAREQSFSKAAEVLFLSQPTLSRQLKDLEDELGKQLFIRGSRKITLTEEGMILRKRAEEIMELIDKTEQEVKLTDDEEITGTIYIGAGETHAISLIARTADKLNGQFPNIRYNFYSADGVDVSERLDKGLIDFGVLFEPMDISRYDSIPIPIHDTWGLLMRRDAPLAEKETIEQRDLWDIPLIVSRQVEDSTLSVLLGKTDGILNIKAQYNLVYNASVMVSEGMGYALCLDRLINVSGDSNLCFRPLYPKTEAVCHFVWKKYPVFTKAAQKFLEQFQQDMREYEL